MTRIVFCDDVNCIHNTTGITTGVRVCGKDIINVHFNSLGTNKIAICDSREYTNIIGTVEKVVEKDDKIETTYNTSVGTIKDTIKKYPLNVDCVGGIKQSFYNKTLYRITGADVVGVLRQFNKLEKYSEDKLIELSDYIEANLDLDEFPHILHMIEMFENEGYLDDNTSENK
jgi:hypothetical protein